MSTPTRDTAVSVSESTFLRDNMDCTQSSQEREPESQVFISPEFGNAIEALV